LSRRRIAAAKVDIRPVKALTSQRGAGGMCDGLSFSEHNTILYALTPDSRRENFTLAHEFAHLTVDKDVEALTWLADRDDPMVELERLCDDIASALLIPNDLLNAVIGAGPITGQHLIDVFTASSASQVACAIAVSSRLNANGAIILTDRTTQTVVHASLVGELSIYPSKNQLIPPRHPLRSIAPGNQLRVKSFWAAPWGERHEFYLSAAASPKRTYAVLADADLWSIESFHAMPSAQPRSERPRADINCRCGFVGVARGWPCPECGRQFCPQCKDCDCQRRAAAEVQCSRCFLNAPANTLEDGLCSGCR
jgi:hypothetical protein